MKIKVNTKAKANFRPNSARAAYYEAICKFNGKSVEEFTKHCTDSPPSTPQKGKYKDKPEPTAGWISWFNRNGYITLDNTK
jgi:hypothetical protein